MTEKKDLRVFSGSLCSPYRLKRKPTGFGRCLQETKFKAYLKKKIIKQNRFGFFKKKRKMKGNSNHNRTPFPPHLFAGALIRTLIHEEQTCAPALHNWTGFNGDGITPHFCWSWALVQHIGVRRPEEQRGRVWQHLKKMSRLHFLLRQHTIRLLPLSTWLYHGEKKKKTPTKPYNFLARFK